VASARVNASSARSSSSRFAACFATSRSGALQLQDLCLGLAEIAHHLSPLATLRPCFEHASRVLRLYELLACSGEICTLGGDVERQQRITAPHLPPIDALNGNDKCADRRSYHVGLARLDYTVGRDPRLQFSELHSRDGDFGSRRTQESHGREGRGHYCASEDEPPNCPRHTLHPF
jgi:hypothetical protein